MDRIVVALGGNALAKAGEKGTWAESLENMEETAQHIARIAASGDEVVLTHGNGPQVGSLLIQQDSAKLKVPELPMSVLGAMTQGWIGCLVEQTLPRAMSKITPKVGKGPGVWPRTVLPLITRVRVSKQDPSFRRPSKPVGPYYSENEARLLKKQQGWTLVHDAARGGWRRVVPSPLPLEILEGDAILRLMDSGLGKWAIPVVAGGGGIPVVAGPKGVIEGVDAVIDKDRTAALLANTLDASTLAIVTDVPGASIGFRTAREQRLGRVDTVELKLYLARGEFGEGSMRPKVEAALAFVENGGQMAVITDAASLTHVLADDHDSAARGTIVKRRHR